MARIHLPAQFVANRVAAEGDAGKIWLQELPHLVDTLCVKWHLDVPVQTPMHGWSNLVLAVEQGERSLILRIGRDVVQVVIEARALENWNGRGSVLLVDHDPTMGALLLERLDHDQTLQSQAVDDAARAAGRLISRLAVRPTGDYPLLAERGREIAGNLVRRNHGLGKPVASKWLTRAKSVAKELSVSPAAVLVHADLHYDNVLAGIREQWLAIDPRPLIGDPEYSVPELMWRRVSELTTSKAVRRHLHAIVDAGDLDLQKALGCTAVRCVDYWLWGLENGLTEDPKRCERVLSSLSPVDVA